MIDNLLADIKALREELRATENSQTRGEILARIESKKREIVALKKVK